MTPSLKDLINRVQSLEQIDKSRWEEIITFNAYDYPSPEAAALAEAEIEKEHPSALVIAVYCQTRKGFRYQDKLFPIEGFPIEGEDSDF